MSNQKLFKISIASLATVTLAFAIFLAASAQAPPNDNFNTPTVITSLPFTDYLDMSGATPAEEDPPQCSYGDLDAPTVWYSFNTIEEVEIQASTSGSDFQAALDIFAISEPEGPLYFIDCDTSGFPVTFTAYPDTTYYFMVTDVGGGGPYPYPYPGPGSRNLVFNVMELSGPPNDNFGEARLIESLPFSDNQDLSYATMEPFEPIPSCVMYYGGNPGQTIWYTQTPTDSTSLYAQISGWYSPFFAVYTGDSLDNLTEITCSVYEWFSTFEVEANATYYYQIGSLYSDGGSVTINLDVIPPPEANFDYYPFDPSSFDNIQFYDNTWDPVYIGVEFCEWDFGDGGTATECWPTHRYAADGEYTVQLGVTTYDGRSDSIAKTVQVMTHDVAITKFATPKSAKAGQTRNITVGIKNLLYPENVEVRLYKSDPGGEIFLGSLFQEVPVRGGNRTTDFAFSYTFTDEDAAVGKVTFKAVANLWDARDALNFDNQAISKPAKVSP